VLRGQTAPADDAEGIAFFEKKIRPVLVERCYECHSSQAPQLEGSLSLETRDGARKGGDQGPAVVPGDPEKSLLIRAIRYSDKDLQMPPAPKAKLPPDVIADFETWIKRGAPDPRTGASAPAAKYVVDVEAARKTWPYTRPVEPAVPSVKNKAWPRNPIDHFILAKLEEKGLAPAPDADKRTLLRRLTYDLTGLPPTPEDVDRLARLAPSPTHPLSPSSREEGESGREGEWEKAYAAYVEQLLSSPRYGERWGRHWLDVVRYADTAGDNSDYPVPQMVKYRNWVINAVNADLPYDQFIRQQIAGDLLPAQTTEQKYQQTIATGYLANARRFGSRVSDYPQHLTIEDTIDNLGRAFLGLSLNCARCHNHKFDPITNEDYYALYGIFHSTRYPWPGIELDKVQRDFVPLCSEEEMATAVAERKKQVEPLAAEYKATEEMKKAIDQLAKAMSERLDALKKQELPAEKLAPAEKELEEVRKKAAELDQLYKATRKKKEEVEKAPLPFPTAYAVVEGKTIENCKVQLKGDPERLGTEVPRRFPVVFGGQTLPSAEKGSGRRQLADWIASPDNPLTARVMVNRLWHHHFGRGLVPTPNDFGKQGQPPSHPELLDYLALRFIDSGWSLKAMHRLIVTSRAYQLAGEGSGFRVQGSGEGFRVQGSEAQASPLNPEPRTLNPLFGSFRRRRLDAESIRDTLLVLGGNLDETMGGEHPFPPQTKWDFTQHKPFKAVYDTNRRSVYLMTQRIQRHPLMAIFDGPDTSASTGSRITSTTTLQALFFLNDPFVHDQAAGLAARLLKERSTDEDRIDLAYQLLFSRSPTTEEQQLGREYLAQQIDKPWESYVRILLRTNEFVYLE
jgi:hypothetical protein